MIDIVKAITYLLLGTITGISTGMIGVGAGILLVPCLIMSGLSIQSATATALMLHLVPQSFGGVWLYYRNGYLDMEVSLLVIMGAVIGITIGSYLVVNNYVSEKQIYHILTILATIIVIYLWVFRFFKNDS